jgi:hypothetical protein
MNPFKKDDFARDKRSRQIGRVIRVKGNMVEIRFHGRGAAVIINYGYLEKVK